MVNLINFISKELNGTIRYNPNNLERNTKTNKKDNSTL
jgi:hypothetical protein